MPRDVQLAYKKKHLGLERPERLLQAYNFVDGSTQCQVSKQSALKKIQQNQLVEESRFQEQANLTPAHRMSATWSILFTPVGNRFGSSISQLHFQ